MAACPNCDRIVTECERWVTESGGTRRGFHHQCFIDVVSGWSGSILPPHVSVERCYRDNFHRVGVVLPPRENRSGL